MADDLHAVRRMRPRFGRRRDAAPHPAIGQKAAQRRQAETRRARETVSLSAVRLRPQRARLFSVRFTRAGSLRA